MKKLICAVIVVVFAVSFCDGASAASRVKYDVRTPENEAP